jgi:hypothetical protein
MPTKPKHNNYTGIYSNLQCYASNKAQNNVQLTYGTQQAVQQPKQKPKKAPTDDLNCRSISAIVYQIERKWCLSIYREQSGGGWKNPLHFYHTKSVCFIGSVSFNFSTKNTFYSIKYDISNCRVLNLLRDYSETTVSFHQVHFICSSCLHLHFVSKL